MENLGDFYYLFQFLIGPFFAYVQDSLFQDFWWFTNLNEDLDSMESNITAVRNVSADLAVLLTICGLLFLLVIISITCGKEEDAHYGMPNIDTFSLANVHDDQSLYYARTVSSGISCIRTCHDTISIGTFGLKTASSLCNYAPSLEDSDESNSPNLNLDNSEHSSNLQRSLSFEHTQLCQGTQTKKKMFRKKAIVAKEDGNRQWIIRQTRSGQVYGKYVK